MIKTLSKLTLQLSGWKIDGKIPKIPKSVIISAPHTSNWDFFYGFLCAKALRLPVKILMKKELFIFPFGIMLKNLGAIPVDRKNKTTIIDDLAELIMKTDEIHIALTPEGTRKRSDNWKTGFYYIAKKANVPIVISYIDYKKKTIGFVKIIQPSDNLENDMSFIKLQYKDVTAKYPQHFSV